MPIAYLKPVFYVVIYANIFTRSSASTQGLKVIFVSRKHSTFYFSVRSPFLFCSHLTGGDSNFDFGSLHTSIRWPQQVPNYGWKGRGYGHLTRVKFRDPNHVSTRSSAIATGPRNASCQLKYCQLSRNSAVSWTKYQMSLIDPCDKIVL